MITLASIKDIATRVKRQKDTSGTGTVVFIGAGCSASAGIPICSEMLTVIEKDYSDLLTNCPSKDYATYMNNLTPSERKKFLDNYIKNAKLNIAHVFLASLVKNGYVDCIVTTNFDNLALKALTTLNEFPAVYDLASSSGYISGMLNFPSVVYLHGQHTGMWQMNTGDEMDSVKKSIAEAFNEILSNRTLIVVGYGGNDPVLDVLADIPRFNHNAYWISYKNEGLPTKVDRIWCKDSKKNIYHLGGYDSDKFFFDLHNELSIQSPDLFTLPFKYLEETYELISKDLKLDGRPYDLTGEARKQISEHANKLQITISKNSGSKPITKTLSSRAMDSLLSWKSNDPDNLFNEALSSNEKDAKEHLSSAYISKGNNFSSESNFEAALESYSRAIKLNSNNEVAFMNYGNTLARLAKLNSDPKLYKESFENYKKAEEINPDYNDIYNNWGAAMAGLAELDSNKSLFEESLKKYEKVLKNNPDDYVAIDNKIGVLLQYSNLFTGKEKIEILNKAKNIGLKNYDLNHRPYNLSCTYALLKEKNNALRYLNESLEKNLISVEHVKNDNDWDNYKEDPDFIAILKKHKK